MVTNSETECVMAALDILISRYEFQREAALIVYGSDHEDTPPVVQAFGHAIRMAQQLKDEVIEEQDAQA